SEVLEALKVPAEWLPPVHESPAIAGAGDQAAGALGVGVTGPGPVSVVLGTSGVVFGVLERFEADAEARVHVFCHAVPGTWHAMGVMLSAAGSLQWLRDIIAPDSPFGTLVDEAAKWPPGCEGLLFAPRRSGACARRAGPTRSPRGCRRTPTATSGSGGCTRRCGHCETRRRGGARRRQACRRRR